MYGSDYRGMGRSVVPLIRAKPTSAYAPVEVQTVENVLFLFHSSPFVMFWVKAGHLLSESWVSWRKVKVNLDLCGQNVKVTQHFCLDENIQLIIDKLY